MKNIFSIVGDGSVAAFRDDFDGGQRASDFIEICQRDLSIIRQDLVAVLEETADMRATLASFSSTKPAITRSFFVMFGLFFLLIIFVMIVYQPQLYQWLHGMRDFL